MTKESAKAKLDQLLAATKSGGDPGAGDKK